MRNKMIAFGTMAILSGIVIGFYGLYFGHQFVRGSQVEMRAVIELFISVIASALIYLAVVLVTSFLFACFSLIARKGRALEESLFAIRVARQVGYLTIIGFFVTTIGQVFKAYYSGPYPASAWVTLAVLIVLTAFFSWQLAKLGRESPEFENLTKTLGLAGYASAVIAGLFLSP